MSDDEQYEPPTDEDNGSSSDSGFSEGRHNGDGDPVQRDSGREDDVQLDKAANKKKMGTDDRVGVKRRRGGKEKHPKGKRRRDTR